MSEEALQIGEKRREVKGKGEKERYTHLNAEFQRIARREQKSLLSEQSKEIEENNRMVKTSDLFRRRQWQSTQYSCLENPRDRGAWWAAIYQADKSQTEVAHSQGSHRVRQD